MTDNNNSNPEQISAPAPGSNTNAWLVRFGDKSRLEEKRYILTVEIDSNSMQSIQTGDAMLITEERNGHQLVIIGIGRVFRKRHSLETTSFYFDGYLPANSDLMLDQISITAPENKAIINRIDWTTFETALKKATNTVWAEFPVISGETSHEQAYIRELLQTAIKDDLLGPADGPLEEIIGMSVRNRYLVGNLHPRTL